MVYMSHRVPSIVSPFFDRMSIAREGCLSLCLVRQVSRASFCRTKRSLVNCNPQVPSFVERNHYDLPSELMSPSTRTRNLPDTVAAIKFRHNFLCLT